MIKKMGVKKLYKDSCPNCGFRNQQEIERYGKYPFYDPRTDTVTKRFICQRCLTEYYETYNLEYNGCEVREINDTEDGYVMVSYDADGNKKPTLQED